jgi:hypothetical protein
MYPQNDSGQTGYYIGFASGMQDAAKVTCSRIQRFSNKPIIFSALPF